MCDLALVQHPTCQAALDGERIRARPVGDLTAYDALRRLRPAFLRSRDVSTPSHSAVAVTVFVNGDRTNGVDALKSLLSRTVREIRFYEPPEANVRFGTGNNGGAILVTLK